MGGETLLMRLASVGLGVGRRTGGAGTDVIVFYFLGVAPSVASH